MDLAKIRKEITSALDGEPELAPLLIRFAWHCSGTYDAKKRNGGSNGGTMRNTSESQDPENAGFQKARYLFERIKKNHEAISFADLYVLGGYVAIEWTGGPKIPFSYGRKDFTEEEADNIYGARGCPFGDGVDNPCGSRLPPADLGPDPACPADAPMDEKEAPTIDAIRKIFTRMGFTDRETVALILLGHQYGQGHKEVSGYEGFWYAFGPNDWNIYINGFGGYMSIYSSLKKYKEVRTSKGKRQYEMKYGGMKWMMLIADMALWWDPEYRTWIEYYNRNRKIFREDAGNVWKKLTELGCDGILKSEGES